MFGFDKSQRLLTKADYACVFEKARKIASGDFVVLYRKNTLSHARLGLAISKKALAKAHERNRIKRLIREAFRKAQLPAVDVLFMAKQGLDKKANLTIYKTLGNIWKKIEA